MSDSITQRLKRYDKLFGDAGTWHSHWQEIGDYVLPRKADFVTQRAPGEKRQQRVFDSTGIHANELLAAGLHGMLTNPATQWFELRIGGETAQASGAVKKWLDDVKSIIFEELNSPGVGFASHMHEIYLDLGAFGTACLFVGEGTRQPLLFQARYLGEIVIAENDEGMVDTVLRRFKWSLRQCVQKWGVDKLSDKSKNLWEQKKYDEQIEIQHSVYPREDYDKGKRTRENLPIASCYDEVSAKHTIDEGGFDEMPLMVPRWQKATGESFGRSPGMTALPDVKMLQEMMKVTIKSAQKIVDPPLQVPHDGFVGPIRTIPSGLNYVRQGVGEDIKPILTGGNIPVSLEMMDALRQQIRLVFFNDQLQLVGGSQMTATEVMQRVEEKLRLMGPVLGRLQSEFLGPMIERVFGILLRANRFPQAPQEVQGKEIRIEYVSPLARAQKQTELLSIARALELSAGIIQLDPSAGMVVRGDETVRHIFELNGVPAKLTNEPERVKEMQQEMAQKQQLAEGAAIAETGSKAIANVARAMPQQGAPV